MALVDAQVDQWREYSRCQLDRCATEKELMDRLKELDMYLSERVYFAGTGCTEADTTIFKSLHTVLTNLSFSEKEAYRNVSRWFDYIQHNGAGKSNLTRIIFLKSPIYRPSLV